MFSGMKYYALIFSLTFSTSGFSKESGDIKVTSVKNGSGFSFSYNDCWKIYSTNNVRTDDDINFYPSPSCRKNEQGTWQMEISSVGTYSNKDFIDDQRKIYSEIFRENRKVGKYDAILYGGISPESGNLVNDKTQKNYGWVLKVQCKKMNTAISYVDHVDKPQRDDLRKDPKIPEPFKFLIDHFACD